MNQSYMLARLERDKLIHKITKVRQKLMVLLDSTFQALCHQYRQSCGEIIAVLKNCATRYGGIQQEMKEILGSCMRVLGTLLKSLQIEKYGNLLSIISYTIKKYEKLNNQKLETINNSQLLTRMSKNQQSQYFREVNLFKISENQRKYNKTEGFQQFMRELGNNQIVLQNRECVCCARVFVKNFQIRNLNPMIERVLDIGEIKGVDRTTLQKFFSAICTEGGGIVIIGAERLGNRLKAVGINFSNMQQIERTQLQILQALLSIKPTCNYFIQRVLVHANYVNPIKVGEESMRLCFRVSIFPINYQKICYVSYALKGRSEIFQSYRLDDLDKPTKLQVQFEDSDEIFPMATIYTFMHEKYRMKKSTPVNSHKNIECFRPYPNYSKLFQKYLEQGQVEPLSPNSGKQSLQQQENISQILYDPEPKFKYQFSSLLVTSSKKHERWIQNYEDELKSKKKIYELCKPFPNSFKQCGRPVWMISHQLYFPDMKGILKQLQSSQRIKKGAIKIMPISKNLQIQSQKLIDKYQKIFDKKFKSRYVEGYTKQIDYLQSEVGKIKTTFFGFNDYGQAIYAYMIFEELQLRPYFVREGNIYKKKNKNSSNIDSY